MEGARRDVKPNRRHRARPGGAAQRFLTREEAQRLVDAITVDENRTAANAILLLMLTGALQSGLLRRFAPRNDESLRRAARRERHADHRRAAEQQIDADEQT